MRRVLLALVLCACQREGARPRGLPDVGPALRAAIGDVDGDGRGEIAVADAGRLRLLDRSGRERASLPVPGAAQALLVADLDGDGRGEIAAGWGRDRAHPDASARVSLYRLEGDALVEEVVAAPASERPEIAALLAEPPDLFVAWYDDRYLVKSAHARRAGDAWRLDEVAALRTAGSYALGDVDGDGVRDLVVGRSYGDEVASDGDAFLLRPDGARVAIPTTRGVHALAVIDGDLFLADGWDKDYGAVARALLTRSRWTGVAFRSQVIQDQDLCLHDWTNHVHLRRACQRVVGAPNVLQQRACVVVQAPRPGASDGVAQHGHGDMSLANARWADQHQPLLHHGERL